MAATLILALILTLPSLSLGRIDLFFPPQELCALMPRSVRFYDRTLRPRYGYDCFHKNYCYDAKRVACFRMKGPVVCEMIAEKLRQNCGEKGISEVTCLHRGCCFKRTNTGGVPWCYLTEPKFDTAADVCHLVPLNYRRQCGKTATNRQSDCDPSCCFIPAKSPVPSCFLPTPSPDPADVCGDFIPSNLRVDCGYSGISRTECESKNCCFSNTLRGLPWCFRPYPRFSGQDVCSRINVPIDRRISCAGPGISRNSCEARNCCYDDSSRDVPWCFKRTPRPV